MTTYKMSGRAPEATTID